MMILVDLPISSRILQIRALTIFSSINYGYLRGVDISGAFPLPSAIVGMRIGTAVSVAITCYVPCSFSFQVKWEIPREYPPAIVAIIIVQSFSSLASGAVCSPLLRKLVAHTVNDLSAPY